MESREEQLNELKRRLRSLPPHAEAEIAELNQEIERLEKLIRNEMTAWDHVQLSRHPQRPYALDYIERIFSDFSEIHGDRKYADDRAIIGGMAILDDQPVMVIGHQKGRNTRERLYRNYGMPKPEGYRKAIRLMRMAEKFNRPIFSFVDTPGAYPGIGAEERGQAEAIAHNLLTMARIQVPIIVTILGEGGSGGALAIGVGDRVLMLEHAIYSVISPESCSAILWKDQDHVREAAESLKLTAEHLISLEVIDEIVPEPPGGAHMNWDQAAASLQTALRSALRSLSNVDQETLLQKRYERFRKIGRFIEQAD